MNPVLLKTLRDLRASLAQSLALTVIAALGVMSFVATVAAYRNLDTSYNSTYDQLLFADVTFSLQSAPLSAVDDVLAVDGVQAATGRLIVDTGLQLPGADGQLLDPIRGRLIGMSAPDAPTVDDVLVLSGRYFSAADEPAVLLDTHLADYYKLAAGDTVTPIINGSPVEFTAVGVATSPEYLIASPSRQEILPSPRSFGVLYVPLEYLQGQVGAADTINDIAVRFTPGANQDVVVSQLTDVLTQYGVSSTVLRAEQPSNYGLNADLGEFRQIAYLMPTIVLMVGAISVYVMMGRQVRAQTPQIGLIKALGYSGRSVMGQYLIYALIVGVTGWVIGGLLGLPLGKLLTQGYAAELSIPIVKARLFPDLVLQGAALSIVAAVAGALIPAYHASRLLPAQAMHFDPAASHVKGHESLAERVVRVPVALRLSLRSVFRVRGRSLTTALGIVFAYILVLMVAGMLDSIQYFFLDNYRLVERWDAAAVFSTLQPAATRDTVAGWAGVTAAEPILQMPVTLTFGGESVDILVTALDPAQDMHVLQLPKGTTAAEALASGQLVVATGLADSHGLAPGDTVTLEGAFGSNEFMLGPTTDEVMSAVGYLSLEKAQSWLGTPDVPYNGLYVSVDSADASQIKRDLYGLPDAVSVQLKADLQADMRSFMGLFYMMLGVMLTVAIAMAGALLYNAMTVNVLERTREFATMRSIGTGIGRVAGLLISEDLILWLVTLVPGLLLGRSMALQAGSAFNADLFTFKIVLSPATYVYTSLGILATMLLATLPAIRQVRRLNLAEATKMVT